MKNIMITIRPMTWSFLAMIALCSCEFVDELPEAGSIADETPPTAGFSLAQNSDIDQFLTYTFGNLSDNAINYLWDFGDGMTSDEFEPEHTFPSIGTYTVSLTASDKLGVVSSDSMVLEIVEPDIPDANLPIVLEPGVELGDAGSDTRPDVPEGDSRPAWTAPTTVDKVEDKNPLIGITSTANTGEFAIKIDVDSDRFGYQELTDFTPNTDYVLTFFYRFNDKTDDPNDGSLRVSMINPITEFDQLEEATVATITLEGSEGGEKKWLQGRLDFNSGTNTTLVIFFDNEVEEIALDDFELSFPE